MLWVSARRFVRGSFLPAVVALGLALSPAQGQAAHQTAITLEPSTVGGAAPGVHSYVGTITGHGGTYPFTAASRDGKEPAGQFESGGHTFALTAILSADALSLTTGGVGYLLARVSDGRHRPVDPEELGQAGPCETPADQLPRRIPTYVESFEATDVEQVLGGILSVGADGDGPWTARLTGASYQRLNTSNPTAVRFCYLLALPGEPELGLTHGTTTLDLSIQAESVFAGAGILFGFEPTTRHHHALVLTQGGYDLYRRAADGLQARLSVKCGTARVGASNHASKGR